MRVSLIRAARAAIIAFIILASSTVVLAQSIVDPRIAEFDPSPDHNALSSSGTPVVQSYSLALYVSGASSPTQTLNLGKPAPDPDGKIRVNFISLLPAPLSAGVTYDARVSAVGPGGNGESTASNPFTFSAQCAPTISQTSQSFASTGGSGSFSVTAAAGCGWTAASSASWVTVTGGTIGSGSGTVTYTVAFNSTASPRTGTITAAGHTFTVTQAALSCSYTLGSTSGSVPNAGGTGSFSVTTGTSCSWTATPSAAWITITAGATGTGIGTVTYSAAANSTGVSRTGTITVGGQTYTITQGGACSFTLGSPSGSVPNTGGTGSFSVTTGSSCSWTATPSASWITITAGAGGTGIGTVTYSAAANSTGVSRTGTITVGGQTYTITQGGACSFALGSSGGSVPNTGGTGSFSVTTGSSCSWTATPSASWITITAGATGTGIGTVTYSAAANTTGAARTGTITVGGQTYTLTQSAPCAFALGSTSGSVPNTGGTGSFSVTTGSSCSWTATPSASWITITAGATGAGIGTVSYSAAANPVTSPRSGTITVAGQTFTISQAAAACTYSLSSPGHTAPADGGAGSFTVTAGSNCAWTAVDSASWITITAGASGTGTGTVSFSVTANTNTSSRSGTITAGGQTFTVTQPGMTCSYSLSAATHSATADGGTATFSVTTLTGCGWSAFTDQPWISITGGDSGVGSGPVTLTVAANTSPSPRTGDISVAGQTFTVDQAGAPCSYAMSSNGSSVPAAGGTGSFALTSGSECPWTTQTSAPWLAVTSASSGSGATTVTFSATANTGPSPRNATITVAGQLYTVSQAAGACTVTTSTTSANLGANGGIGLIMVTAAGTCSWAAATQASWITITAGGVGSGNANVSYAVAANPDTTPRSGIISIGGQTFTVNQAAAACGFTLSPASQSAAAAGGPYSVTVTTTAGCTWTASSNVPWITVSAAGTRTGTGTVNYTVAPNAGSFTRSGSLTIAGRFFAVSQVANSCSVTVNPASISASSTGGQVSVTIATGSGCAWTAATSTPWITVLTPTGSGSGLATVRLAANTGTQVRTGSFTVGGVTINVSQGVPLTAPTGLRIIGGGGQ